MATMRACHALWCGFESRYPRNIGVSKKNDKIAYNLAFETIYNKTKFMCDGLNFKCKQCGVTFEKTKSELSKNHNVVPVFCSKDCQQKWYKENSYITVECKCCGKEFTIKKGEYNKNKNKNFFCSHSCAAKFNNKTRTIKKTVFEKDNKIKISKKKEDIYGVCPICGNKKFKKSILCKKCRNEQKRNNIKKRTLGYFIEGKKYLGSKCNEIRKDAKRTIEESCVEKTCAYCHNHEFDGILEVHHIKGILEFDKSTTIEEINDINNLVWLCPNHHRMLELGLIKLEK